MGPWEAVDDGKAASNASDNILNFSGSVWKYLWIQFKVCKYSCLLPVPRAVTPASVRPVESCSDLPSDTPCSFGV